MIVLIVFGVVIGVTFQVTSFIPDPLAKKIARNVITVTSVVGLCRLLLLDPRLIVLTLGGAAMIGMMAYVVREAVSAAGGLTSSVKKAFRSEEEMEIDRLVHLAEMYGSEASCDGYRAAQRDRGEYVNEDE